MREKKVKILLFNYALSKGGTESYFLNLCKNIDKNKFEMALIVKIRRNVDDFFYNEFIKSGTKVYFCGDENSNKKQELSNLKKFFKQHRGCYDLMHINCASAKEVLVALVAKYYGGIKNYIFHSHMGGSDIKISKINFLYKFIMNKMASKRLACSDEAGRFVFGKRIVDKKDFILINNSIDLKRFCYSIEVRENTRKQLKIARSAFVILNIGRFAHQKNHSFLLDIFSYISKKDKTAKLLLIGEGDLKFQISQKAKELGLDKKVIFLGLQEDTSKFMQASDILLMPSFHEGLPIVCVESQATGLKNILSTNISKQSDLTQKNIFISLAKPPEKWAEEVLKQKGYKRENQHKKIISKNFDNKSAIEKIQNIYWLLK